MLPKGQQKLTTFSDLVEEGLSYLQLFLEFPETVWSLQNRSYIKKHHFPCSGSPFVEANLAFGLKYMFKRLHNFLFALVILVYMLIFRSFFHSPPQAPIFGEILVEREKILSIPPFQTQKMCRRGG